MHVYAKDILVFAKNGVIAKMDYYSSALSCITVLQESRYLCARQLSIIDLIVL